MQVFSFERLLTFIVYYIYTHIYTPIKERNSKLKHRECLIIQVVYMASMFVPI